MIVFCLFTLNTFVHIDLFAFNVMMHLLTLFFVLYMVFVCDLESFTRVFQNGYLMLIKEHITVNYLCPLLLFH